MMNTWRTVRGSAPGWMTASVDFPLASGVSSLMTPTSTSGGNTPPRPVVMTWSPLSAQGAAGEVREDAQAVGGVVGAAGDDAVVPGAGHDARRIEAGVQDGHDLAAGEVGFPHHAQQIALVADDGVVDGHTVQCASVQREAPEGVQRVAANDERGRVAHLRVLLLDVGQRLVGLVLGLELVVVHHLGA